MLVSVRVLLDDEAEELESVLTWLKTVLMSCEGLFLLSANSSTPSCSFAELVLVLVPAPEPECELDGEPPCWACRRASAGAIDLASALAERDVSVSIDANDVLRRNANDD